MNDTPWLLLDTETTGIHPPIFVVELAAQRMRGWLPEGPAFRRLLNQNAVIPPEASRVHGYTREILERDGEPASEVYAEFAAYAADRPLVAYHLSYDLDEVLLPEWARLGIAPIGQRGFCALRLAQRLLDPVPAGNCKLQTLRQYYRLPERGAHTALGDVATVTDLLALVLRPLAERRGLDTWASLCEFAGAEWYPSRIAFGKFKGRRFQDARTDPALREWLDWLAASSNPRSARLGRWYLGQLAALAKGGQEPGDLLAAPDAETTTGGALVIWLHPELEELKRGVAAARARLAELEALYTQERHAVEVTQSRLFALLREPYQKRDRLRLVIAYRQRYLDLLLHSGEAEAESINPEYAEARRAADAEYEEAASAAAERQPMSEAEALELKTLWRQLVRLYHPDRFTADPQKQAAFQRLTSAINQARDAGDIALLREIAQNPEAFMLKQGWDGLDFGEAADLAQWRRLFESLQQNIVMTLERLNELHEDPGYELHTLCAQQPDYLREIAADQARRLEAEIVELAAQAANLAAEIAALTDEATASRLFRE